MTELRTEGIREKIRKVLIIGSGPIVIGQACEFDYSGTQACKALMNEGLEVVLVNSNPATIMTDPEIATRVYIEPLKVSFLERIIEREKPDALIPTLGGQTALNLALELDERGILLKHNVKLLGANAQVIKSAEDRELFRSILDRVGARYPASYMVRTFEEGLAVAVDLKFPLILRPNYTLGGGGGGIAYSLDEYKNLLVQGLGQSPTSEVLVECSILGWKEFELEVMRDRKGTFVVVCTIENIDPCGVHTGDSITVAPQQTLSDVQYQAMRDEACRILNEVGVETGGANIQFAVHPTTGERVVIEMNPRVSRSSALASKATGFPIAKIAALLAVGHTLDEIRNDITKVTPSCYEPALDYVVTKIPRFDFPKFSGSKDILTTQMRSVGEVMALGRTLQESLMKAVLALEAHPEGFPVVELEIDKIAYANSKRIYHIFQAFREGMSILEINKLTQIDPYFLEQIFDLVQWEKELGKKSIMELGKEDLLRSKRKGFSDALIAKTVSSSLEQIIRLRRHFGISPAFLPVDTCAGEFESHTPYYYSTYWTAPLGGVQHRKQKLNSNTEQKPDPKTEQKPDPKTIAVMGSGPNRIGQGIEFDYCCVRGVKALQRLGHQVIMINSNPETVSTDYDTADILFFEPLTVECVDEVLRWTQAEGFISQLGGQTPLNLAEPLVGLGHSMLGSTLSAIDGAEDRGLFSKICRELKIKAPRNAMAASLEQASEYAGQIGYPVICRPSYVLGGRRMEVIENQEELESYFNNYGAMISREKPCLIDQFLEGALEVDVDLVRGVDWMIIGGVVEHIEAAGVHSGDSMGVIPPQRLKLETCERIERLSQELAHKLGVLGYLNLQLAVKDDEIFVLEANPRSSRSVPFIAKSTQIPLVDLGVAAMTGKTFVEVNPDRFRWRKLNKVNVKGVVFPFRKFPEADSILGPEMKSTGESMGRADHYPEALMKAILSSQVHFPHKGEVFFSLRDKDKDSLFSLAQELHSLGYAISATGGTAQHFIQNGLKETIILKKVHEGRPHCVDHIRQGKVAFVINTTRGRVSIEASFNIRRACTDFGIPCLTESGAAQAFVLALKSAKKGLIQVEPIQSMVTL